MKAALNSILSVGDGKGCGTHARTYTSAVSHTITHNAMTARKLKGREAFAGIE